MNPAPCKNLDPLRKKILTWYGAHARDLPWRQTRDPYKIWVSEIMLQQTQVETVIPYFNRWIKRFPTVRSLAGARREEVLRYWAGLGYYRRARMLHEAAKRVAKKFSGKLPDTAGELMRLPGIGRYTAGAIASIAFGRPEPVLDGNIRRVLSRLFAVREAADQPAGEKKLWGLAAGLVESCKRPGDLNQALMELGATTCTPVNPACMKCPVSKGCAAHKLHRETEFPVQTRKEVSENVSAAALILRRNGRVLIERQPENGRWGSLWMFPHLNGHTDHTDRLPGRHRMTIHHGFTKYRIRLDVYEAETENLSFPKAPIGNPALGQRTLDPRLKISRMTSLKAHQLGDPKSRSRWVKIADLIKFPFPSPHQKIVQDLIKNP